MKGRSYANVRMQHLGAPKDEANTIKDTTGSMLLTVDVEAKEVPSVFLQKDCLKMNLK